METTIQQKLKPVILLAFANEQEDGARYLRKLPKEANALRNIFDKATVDGLCQMVILTNATLSDIVQTLQDPRYRDRIAIFHYGGHANSYELMLESTKAGESGGIYGKGLMRLLGNQRELKFVFLNGCHSENHSRELLQNGVPAVIGTARAIDDDVATDLAIRFYQGLTAGIYLSRAWKEAVATIIAKYGMDDFDVYYHSDDENTRGAGFMGQSNEQFPWKLDYRPGYEALKAWNLPDAVGNPLFGLPEIPNTFDLPANPYQFLKYYERNDANVYFGRGRYIRSLYQRLTSTETSPVICLYGQSGVGKSSLINAGLIPRIETDYQLVYLRKRDNIALLDDFKSQGLGIEYDGQDLKEEWMSLEQNSRKKARIIIIDQLEKVFTDDNTDQENELENFLTEIQGIFKNPQDRPKGKLLLSYRKEYDSEIDKALKSHFIPTEKIFLDKLEKADIIEVVKGLTSSPRLRSRYGLSIEEGLPMIIADNLLKDKESAISPVLQIILTKLWHRQQYVDHKQFTVEDYNVLLREGIVLYDFFQQQMKQMNAWENEINKEVESSGLALDVLNYHTTKYATARTRSLEDLREEYTHQQAILDQLVNKFQDLYLLSRRNDQGKIAGDEPVKKTILAHDTLGPIIQEEMRTSNRPGQQAARILNAKMPNYEAYPDSTYIDVEDLTLVEQGEDGMRIWTPLEKELIDKSRERREKLKQQAEEYEQLKVRTQKLRRSRLIMGLVAASIIGLAAITFAIFNSRVAKTSTLISEALNLEKDDPTQSLNLLNEALSIMPNQVMAQQAKHDVLSNQNGFYDLVEDFKAPIDALVASTDGISSVIILSDEKIHSIGQGELVSQPFDQTEIVCIAFAEKSRKILSGDKNYQVKVWNLDGQEAQSFNIEHVDWVNTIAIGPNEEYIATGGRDNKAMLWTFNGELLQTFDQHNDEIYSVAFHPTEQWLLTGSKDQTARLLDFKGNELKAFEEHKDRVTVVNFSPNGRYVITGDESGKIIVSDTSGAIIHRLNKHAKSVKNLTFTKDSRYMISSGNDNELFLWDFENGEFLLNYSGHTDRVSGLTLVGANQNSILSASRDGTIRQWSIEPLIKAHFGPIEGYSIARAVISNDQSTIAAVPQFKDRFFEYGRPSRTKHQGFIWKDETLDSIGQHNMTTYDIAMSPDQKRFITTSADRKAILWNIDNREEKTEFIGHERQVKSIVVDWDKGLVLTGGMDNKAFLWNMDGEIIDSLIGHSAGVNDVDFIPGTDHLITGGLEGKIRIWTSQGDSLNAFGDHGGIHKIAVSKDGQKIASCSAAEMAIIWDINGDSLYSFKWNEESAYGGRGGLDIAFSNDGEKIAVAVAGGVVYVFNLDGEKLLTYQLPIKNIEIRSCSFTADDQSLLIGADDGYARLVQLY